MKFFRNHEDWLHGKLKNARFAAGYLNATAQDDDPRSYILAL